MTNSTRKYICECDNPRCRSKFKMTPHRFAILSRRGNLVIPSHRANYQVVIQEGPGYAVVRS